MTKARDLANVISGSGTLNANVIPALPASKITSGTFADARLSSSSVTQHVDLTSLSASNLTSGTVPSARLSLSASDVPDLATSKITSGTFADARISSSSVTAHVDLTALDASNLTSGTIPNARYGTPTFNGSSITNISAMPLAPTTGTWTLGISNGGINAQTAIYQKFGRLCFCQCEFQIAAWNGPGFADNYTTQVNFSGLPFTSRSESSGHTYWYQVAAGSMHGPAGDNVLFIRDNSNIIEVRRRGDTDGRRLTQYLHGANLFSYPGYGNHQQFFHSKNFEQMGYQDSNRAGYTYMSFMYITDS